MIKPVCQYRKILLAWCCLVLCMASMRVHAQKESYSQKLQGYLKPGDSCVVIDDKYALLGDKEWGNIKHLKVEDLITFQLRFDTLAHIPHRPFKVELLVDVYYWTSDRSKEKPEEKKNISLRIEYDTLKGKAIKIKDYFRWKDAHKMAVVIRKIKGDYFKDSLPPFFQLKNELFVKRQYPFDPSRPVKMVISSKTKEKALPAPLLLGRSASNEQSRLLAPEDEEDCGQAAGVEHVCIPATLDDAYSVPAEYDIEYCFVDYDSEEGNTIRTTGVSSLTDAFCEGLFRFNGTRVTLPEAISSSGYDIYLVYPRGYMFYRIRGVGYSGDIRDERNAWSYREDPMTSSSAIFMRAIGDGSVGCSSPHEACLNWQYTASFAEDAKHKDVVSYFDGKLQTRQTVTLSKTHIANDEDVLTAVVQETILDEFGRPTVNILPTPTDDTEIKYYRDFNISNASSKPYNYTDLAADGEDCSEFAHPLKIAEGPEHDQFFGAGRYYSTSNPFRGQGNHQFVPDANGYPFTVTQYTPDQTGRIRNQGGVGMKFQVKKDDSEHSFKYSKYYYGKPTQFQLDRLFGSEAGNSSHYQKNMVVDPNGQISVSYVNSTGKTVATALAGMVTPNLDQLPSYFEPDLDLSPATSLIKPTDFSFDATSGELQATATFLAPVAGSYKLKSQLEKLQYQVFHGPSLTSQLCYTCYYDIVVDVRNSCNISLLPDGIPYTVAAGSSFDASSSCLTMPTTLSSDDLIVTIAAANIGECYVTYTLKPSKEARDAYTQDHWENNTSLKKFKYFFEKLMNEASMKDCYSECEPCKELATIGKVKFVADLKTYIQKVIAVKNDPNITYSAMEAEAYLGLLYDSLTENCENNVLPSCVTPGPCEGRLVAIKNDVSPGGQYALYSIDDPDHLIPLTDPTSIFYGSPAKYTQMPTDWGYTHIYPNPDNPLVSDIVVKDDGTAVQPEALSPEEFIKYFRPHWANTLALWHPEYCYYKWCILNEPSRVFDEKIRNMGAEEAMDTHSTFTSTKYFVPNASGGAGTVNSLLANDPFFQPCGAGYPYLSAMNWELMHFKKLTDPMDPDGLVYVDLLEFIDHTLYCNSGSWVAGSCTPADECRKREREWHLFVNHYLQLKQRYDEMARRCWKSTCVNCYIGTDGINREDLIEDPDCTRPDEAWLGLLPLSCGVRPNEGCSPANPENEDEDAAINPCMESLCEMDSRRDDYENKTRLYPEYVDPCTVANMACSKSGGFTSNINDSINKMFEDNCTAAVENLLEELAKRGCTSHLDPTDLAALKTALITNCKQGLDQLNPADPITGVIQVLHPDAVSSSSSNRFQDILAGSPYSIDPSNGCSVDLVGLPYPHDKQSYQLAQVTVDQASTSLCTRLTGFKNMYKDAHSGDDPSTEELYTFMQDLLQQDFIMTLEEFEDLVGACDPESECDPKWLDKDITLPAALTKDNPCKTCDEIDAALVLFNATYTHLSATDPQYELLFKNFMNHHFGYTLTYADYYYFMQECEAEHNPENMLLCDKSGAPQFLPEEYSCLKDKIDNAFSGAIYLYYQYKDSVDQSFRNAYTFACRYAKPTLTLKEPFQEYHYTLYYYDQAGNLVKTVPPQGVRTLSNTDASNVAHPWENPVSNHYLQIDGAKYFTLQSSSLSDAPISVEMWLNKASGSGPLTIFDATLSKQQAHNTLTSANDPEKMKLELNSSGNFVFTHDYFTGTSGAAIKHTDAYTFSSSSLPTGSWKQVALVYSPSSSCLVYVDGVPYIGTASPSSSPLAAEWDLDPLTTSTAMVFNAGGSSTPAMAYKEMRVYRRSLSADELGFNRILADHPYSYTEMDAYYKLNEGSGTTLNNLTANVLAGTRNDAVWVDNTPTFAATSHFFVTSYAYNSLNQVVKQHTPDGGTSRFWYDRLGRLVISQNGEQLSSSVGDEDNRFSYTKYDALGRVMEVGEKTRLPELNDAEVRDNCLLNKWLFNLPATDIDPGCLAADFSAGVDKQITLTRYTSTDNTGAADGRTVTVPSTSIVAQENLRNRVAATFYIEEGGQSQQFATYYNYDISGNVKTLWQQLVPMAAYDGSGIKRMDYDYDLVSGKVNKVWYQQGKTDQYYYQYNYDAENRLTEAFSGKGDGPSECKLDAAYFYYLHGPLARMELGEDESKLQGVDYAYTLQGWLKGVNGTLLDRQKDMGQDGYSGSLTRANFGRDVCNFGLNYYSEDYTAIISTPQPFSGYTFSTKTDTYPVGRQLFNGNISSISLSLYRINNGLATGYNYGYDQLNRLVNMRTSHHEILATGEAWGRDDIEEEKYAETYSYDANGNIMGLKRNGPGTTNSPFTMDDLKYRYYYVTTSDEEREYYFNTSDKKYYDDATDVEIDPANVKYFTNKLAHVNDETAYTSLYTTDIDDQDQQHYTYDRIGNMVGDNENGKSIRWTVYGKIRSVSKTEDDATVKNIQYQYDVSGNRVVKKVNSKTTFYIRDAQGNTMAVYDGVDPGYGYTGPEEEPPAPTGYTWQEQNLYGSSRLGMFTPRIEMPKVVVGDPPVHEELAGQRVYELSNHLGNVHVTIANILREGEDEAGAFFIPEILTTNDYYPFGMLMPERHGYKIDGGWANGGDNINGVNMPQDMTVDSRTGTPLPDEYKASRSIEFLPGFESLTSDEFIAYIATGGNTPGTSSGGTGSENIYRYGFNGKENDDEVKGLGNQQDYGMRIYDTRLGRFLSVDPITKKYPELTPYQFASNSPIWAIDLDGLEGFVATGMPMGNSGFGHGMIINPQMASQINHDHPWIAKGLIIGLAVAVDIFLTKGAVTKSLLQAYTTVQVGNVIGAMHYADNAATPEIKRDIIKQGANDAAHVIMGAGIGKTVGVTMPIFKSASNIFALRKKLAESFFRKSGVKEIERHMAAIHFEDAVSTQVLDKGTVLYRYSEVGTTTPKHYFFTEDPSITPPTILGKMNFDPNKTVLEQFTLTKSVKVLNSTVDLAGSAGAKQVFSTELQAASTSKVIKTFGNE